MECLKWNQICFSKIVRTNFCHPANSRFFASLFSFLPLCHPIGNPHCCLWGCPNSFGRLLTRFHWRSIFTPLDAANLQSHTQVLLLFVVVVFFCCCFFYSFLAGWAPKATGQKSIWTGRARESSGEWFTAGLGTLVQSLLSTLSHSVVFQWKRHHHSFSE